MIRRPGPLPVAGLAALVALQFLGGHPETSFHVMFATVLPSSRSARCSPGRSGGRERRALARPTLAFGGALVLGTALAALTLLPLIEFLFHSGDYQRRLDGRPSHASRSTWARSS